MLQRLIITVAIAGCLFPALAVRADDNAAPDLKALHGAVEKLVEKHYPKAKVSLDGGTIHFEFNTRKFMIHEPLLTGEWQDAVEEVGPQKGGIVGNLVFQPGKYSGMASVPQSFDKRYYVVRLLASDSEKLDGHLLVHLSYSRGVAPELLKEFERLVHHFDEYVSERLK